MKVPEKSGGNDRIGAMLRDLPASLDEVQVGKSRRQEQQRDAQLRVQRLHHFRVLMADETPKTSTFLNRTPVQTGEESVLSRLVGPGSLDPPPTATSGLPVPDRRRVTWRPAVNADFRGRLTCLFHTQFPPRTVRFFLVFLAFERRDMGAL